MQKIWKTNSYTTLAVGLLAFSFVPYGLMLLLPWFSLSLEQNALSITALVVAGEVFQWMAILLAGKQLITKYKKRLNPLKWVRRNRKKIHAAPNSVYVFKTSVLSESDISVVKPHLDNLLQGCKWNFDLEDCDNILRIESNANVTPALIKIFNDCNYQCEELS